MSPARKFLYGAFTLVITVALIYMGFRIFGRSSIIVDTIIEGQDETGKVVSEYDVLRYDGYEISGSTAIDYIKTVIIKYDIPVDVTTDIGTFTCTDQSNFKKFRDISSTYYINPLRQYTVTVNRDSNEVITKVEIGYIP